MEKKFRIEAAAACHMGNIRTNNEDNLFFDHYYLKKDHIGINDCIVEDFSRESLSSGILFGVFDGMGGQSKGELASYITAEETGKAYRSRAFNSQKPEDSMREICRCANNRVCKAMEEDKSRIGTTASLLFFKNERAFLCNIGDSPIYLLRNGSLTEVYEEHTDRRLREKLYGKDAVKGKKFPLNQHIGIFPSELEIDPYTTEISLENKDYLLICSDGLSDMVPESEIVDILKPQAVPVHKKVLDLRDAALRHGGRDNITIILIRVVNSDEPAPSKDQLTDEEKKKAFQQPDLISVGTDPGDIKPVKADQPSPRRRAANAREVDKNTQKSTWKIVIIPLVLISVFFVGCLLGSIVGRKGMEKELEKRIEKELKKQEPAIRKKTIADRNKQLFESGSKCMDDGDYEEALEFFALIDKDWESYDEVDGLIEQCKESLTEEVLAEADDYLEEGKEDKALDSLVQALKITGPNKEIEQKIQSILKKNISKSKKTRGNTE